MTSSKNDFDLAVIGAGAVGLAVAREAAKRGLLVIVLEKNATLGMGISSRNSEVIHAGLYYPTGSLKHTLCVSGRRKLYRFLEESKVPHRKCGKLLVATNEKELSEISLILTRARENGVEDIRLINADELAHIEPEVTGLGALWSPETGIFDSHGYMTALTAEIELCGGLIAYRSQVSQVIVEERGFSILTAGKDATVIKATNLVNSAGLMAPTVAKFIKGLDPKHIPIQRLAKGSYFALRGKAPFRHLIYPVPVDGGLGVHSTLDLSGRIRFGPDVEWLPSSVNEGDVDYKVDPNRAAKFYAAIRRYWPGLKDGALSADFAGCRPKLSAPSESVADFLIQSQKVHHIPGLINLFGIESPGLTSSLAIADQICNYYLEINLR